MEHTPGKLDILNWDCKFLIKSWELKLVIVVKPYANYILIKAGLKD